MSNFKRPDIVPDLTWQPSAWTPPQIERHLAQHQEWMGIAIGPARIGGQLFSTRLELEYFPPIGPVNDLLQLIVTTWPDQAMPWFLAALPQRYAGCALQVAQDTGMKLADGVPWMFIEGALRVLVATRERPPFPADVGGTLYRFPFHGPNIWTLENDSESDPLAYTQKRDELWRLEQLQIDIVRQEFRDRYRAVLEQYAAKKEANHDPQEANDDTD